MILDVGKTVVYPRQGPCRIGAVVNKIVGGNAMSFYQLAVLDDSGDALFVPVDKAVSMGVRQLITKTELPKLLSRLEEKGEAIKLPASAINWKQRVINHAKLLASGSVFDLAEIIRSLTQLNEIKALSPRDRQVLDKARRNLICEIAEVMGENKAAAERRLDKSLQVANPGLKIGDAHS